MNRVCGHCGVSISHKRANAIYCSRTCKSAACHIRIRRGSEAERERNRARYARESDRRTEYARQAYWRDPEGHRDYSREWRRANPARRAEQSANRRALQYGNANYVGLTDGEWQRLVRRFRGCCAYCGTAPETLHRDHVVPLVRGGRHAPANTLPSCQSCNSSKSALFLTEWRVRQRKERR